MHISSKHLNKYSPIVNSQYKTVRYESKSSQMRKLLVKSSFDVTLELKLIQLQMALRLADQQNKSCFIIQQLQHAALEG